MNVNDIKKYLGVTKNAHVANALDLSKVTIGKWAKNGIPIDRQSLLQLQTNHKLQADKSLISPLVGNSSE
ncbi:Cro/CI family transcriptional regulator [Faucicola mancuniensis]|uniref:Cro/CI family transcriptional regulator n=1 Tax=Faucicola mancuniensis TaxID=1309795 RepID=UPI003977B6BA